MVGRFASLGTSSALAARTERAGRTHSDQLWPLAAPCDPESNGQSPLDGKLPITPAEQARLAELVALGQKTRALQKPSETPDLLAVRSTQPVPYWAIRFLQIDAHA